jgi:hypothetical protein
LAQRSHVGDDLFLNFPGGSDITVNTLPTDDIWYHVVVTYDADGDNASIYVDGEIENSGTTTYTVNAERITLGNYNQHSYDYGFNGSIDNFMWFNRTLRPEEIKALYNFTANGFDIDFSDEGFGQHSIQAFVVDTGGMRIVLRGGYLIMILVFLKLNIILLQLPGIIVIWMLIA